MSSSSTSFSASARPVRASVLPRARKTGLAPRPSADSVTQPAVPSYMRSTASSRSRACPASAPSNPRRPASPSPSSQAPISLPPSTRSILRPASPSPSSQAPIPLPSAPTLTRHAPCPPSLARFGFLRPAAPADEAQPIDQGNFARLLVRVLEGKHRDETLPGRLDAFRKAQEKRVLQKARLRREKVLGFSCQDQIPVFSAAVAASHPPRSVRWAPVLTRSRQFDLTEAPRMVRRATTRFSSQA